MKNEYVNRSRIAHKLRGLCDFPGETVKESTVGMYKCIGDWLKANAEMLAADSHNDLEAVPIVLEIKIDNAITTIEKKTKYYLTEEKE